MVNPTFIAGPSLVPALRSTLTGFKAIIEGTMAALPRQRFGIVDARDVAHAHITAMATPAAAGKRYLLLADGPTITWLGLAQILRDHLGPAGEHVTTDEAPGEDPARLTIHNDRAKYELGWQPRPAETTVVETAESLRDLGLLEKTMMTSTHQLCDRRRTATPSRAALQFKLFDPKQCRMPHPNEALLRGMFAASSRGDIDALRSQYWAEDIRWHVAGWRGSGVGEMQWAHGDPLPEKGPAVSLSPPRAGRSAAIVRRKLRRVAARAAMAAFAHGSATARRPG